MELTENKHCGEGGLQRRVSRAEGNRRSGEI